MASDLLALQAAGVSRADQSITGSTTYADITTVTVDLIPGSYVFQVILPLSAGAGGVKAQLTGTATVSTMKGGGYSFATGRAAVTSITALGTELINVAGAGARAVQVEGTITVSAAGTLKIQGAQNSSNAAATTFQQGCFIRVWSV